MRKENEFGGAYYQITINPDDLQWILDLLTEDADLNERSQEIYDSLLRQMRV